MRYNFSKNVSLQKRRAQKFGLQTNLIGHLWKKNVSNLFSKPFEREKNNILEVGHWSRLGHCKKFNTSYSRNGRSRFLQQDRARFIKNQYLSNKLYSKFKT